MSQRVLLVDRDNALRLMVDQHLRRVGYEVEASDEPQDALERAALSSFDVVVASTGLPGLSPGRLVEALSSLRPAPALVLLEGRRGEEGITLARRGGRSAFEVLQKPIDRADVEAAVVRAARHRHEEACRRLAVPKAPPAAAKEPRPARGRRRGRSAGPARVGRYEVLERLGAGPTGTAYRCADATAGRPLVVKVIRKELAERTGRGARWLDRFRRAAGAAASIGHPALVPLVDYGVDEAMGCVYLVSELVDGSSLARRVEEGRPLAPALALRVAFGVADALRVVHEARMAHRRVSPGNVLLGKDGAPKLTDLPVGTALSWDQLPLSARPEGPGHASPEQLRTGRVGARSEQFSLGTVLHEALSGRPCFRGGSIRARLTSILEEPPPPIEVDGRPLPEALDALVRRMLAKDPADRFASDDELLDAMAACGASLGVTLERATTSAALL